MNNNEWYVLKKYPKYAINKNGEVKNIKTDLILKQSTQRKNGKYTKPHKIIGLPIENSCKDKCYIYRLMLDTFIDNKARFIKHIDGNVDNNNIDNLQYRYPKEK